jgi:site-specific recombinase XerD
MNAVVSVSSSTNVLSLERILSLVLDSVRSANSRRVYRQALLDFLAWHTAVNGRSFTKAAVQEYRVELDSRGLSASSINLRLSAIRKLAAEAADNGLLPPGIAAGIARVKGPSNSAVRLGYWLGHNQAEALIQLPDRTTTKGKRDCAMLALLIGCGLRRNELVTLTFEHVQQRDGRWVIADMVGKGGRTRTIPMPGWTKKVVNEWAATAKLTSGPVIRGVSKGDRITDRGVTAQAVFNIVKGYGVDLRLPIAPHDLRRTFAKLAHKGHAPLEQIQLSLGHASILTTERYLGIRQNLLDAPCDHLGLQVLEE